MASAVVGAGVWVKGQTVPKQSQAETATPGAEPQGESRKVQSAAARKAQQAGRAASLDAAAKQALAEILGDDEDDFPTPAESEEESENESQLAEDESPDDDEKDKGRDDRSTALETRIAQLERQLEKAQAQAQEPEEEEDDTFDYEVNVPEGFEGLGSTLKDIGTRHESQFRALEKRMNKFVLDLAKQRAQQDWDRFTETTEDWEDMSEVMADIAESLGKKPTNLKELKTLYGLAKAKSEAGKMKADRKAASRAGASPRFSPSRAATREELSYPGNGRLTLQQSMERAALQIAKGRLPKTLRK